MSRQGSAAGIWQRKQEISADDNKGEKTMKSHIEYDDFGEYLEVLEDCDEYGTVPGITGGSAIRKTMKKLLLIAASVMVMFGTSSYAAGTAATGTGDNNCRFSAGSML